MLHCPYCGEDVDKCTCVSSGEYAQAEKKREDRRCADCKYLQMREPKKRCFRHEFHCDHKDQAYIRNYHKWRHMVKDPSRVCYGTGPFGDIPSIKSSPDWCPLKKRKKDELRRKYEKK